MLENWHCCYIDARMEHMNLQEIEYRAERRLVLGAQ